MSHNFSQVPKVNLPRSVFDRSHGHKTTFDAGWLIPFYVDEALPGDTFKMNASIFARLATPVAPVMDNMFMDTFFFAVPNRLLWENWEKFNGAQDEPGDPTDYVIPQLTDAGGYSEGSLQDHLGIPTGVTNMSTNALFTRAYNLIWNEWFRDQNLQSKQTVDIDNGPDSAADYILRRRGKRHDYFTSCLPWPQKGESVQLPLGSEAPVWGDGNVLGVQSQLSDAAGIFQGTGIGISTSTTTYKDPVGTPVGTPSPLRNDYGIGVVSKDNTTFAPASGLIADLSDATAATINQIRLAFQTQKMLERDARGGTRYVEIIRAHFGVQSPDFRLQRPEYLGGGSSRVNITPVPQTSETSTTPQGTQAGYGVVASGRNSFSKSFTEHCVLIGLVCARADLTYQQGLDRMFSRSTRYDFYWPAFAHIGEQAVLSKEIYMDDTSSDDDVFGYQERWAEYRYKPSKITGQFRSSAGTSLDYWHLSQDFATRPLLNGDFMQENPPVDRVIAVPSEPHFIFDSYMKLTCARPMPVYSVPGMIDHF